jgi:hypothetical protein
MPGPPQPFFQPSDLLVTADPFIILVIPFFCDVLQASLQRIPPYICLKTISVHCPSEIVKHKIESNEKTTNCFTDYGIFAIRQVRIAPPYKK